jgi:hypothetical protein
MIAIKFRQDKYRLEVREEEFEFSSRAEMENALKYLLDLKEINGRLNKE